MSIRLQIILLICLLFVLVSLINQVRKKKVDLKYTLLWFVLDIALILLTCFPKALAIAANNLGIVSPINMIFFCGFVFSLLIIYMLTVAISKLSDQVRNMAQKIALMEKGEKDAK